MRIACCTLFAVQLVSGRAALAHMTTPAMRLSFVAKHLNDSHDAHAVLCFTSLSHSRCRSELGASGVCC